MLMELELSRMAFFCGLQTQRYALSSWAPWSAFPLVAVHEHLGLNRVLSEKGIYTWSAGALHLRPLPLAFTSPFCVGSAKSRSVNWMNENQIQSFATKSEVGILKSVSKRFYFLLVWLWEVCHKNLLELFHCNIERGGVAAIPVVEHCVTFWSPTQSYIRHGILSLEIQWMCLCGFAALPQTARQTWLKQLQREPSIFINSVAKRNSSCLLSLRKERGL